MNSIICPISKDKTNRHVARITGFLVASSIVAYAITGNIFIIFGLLIDFYIRAYTSLKMSPLSYIASKAAKLLRLTPVFIDKAPKIFASRVGLVFSSAIILLYFVSPIASLIVAFTLMGFALLESLFNFCVGCIVYTYLVLPFYKSSNA